MSKDVQILDLSRETIIQLFYLITSLYVLFRMFITQNYFAYLNRRHISTCNSNYNRN